MYRQATKAAPAGGARVRGALVFDPGCGPRALILQCLRLDTEVWVFLGSDDEEVSPAVCSEVPSRSQGGALRLRIFDGVTHDFDDPGPVRQSVAGNRAAKEEVLTRSAPLLDALPPSASLFQKARTMRIFFALTLVLCGAARAAEPPPVDTGSCAAQTEGSTACPLDLSGKPASSASAPPYALIAKEGAKFTLLEPQVVRYGAGSRWSERSFGAGVSTVCSNLTFGDPFPNTVKRCEVRGGPPIALATSSSSATMPARLDHSRGVEIDPALLAAIAPASGSSAARVRTTWHRADRTDCAPNTAGCSVVDAEKPVRSDIGDFREPTAFAKFGNFDPIVYANDPTKASHAHTFMGNSDIAATTTPDNIMGCASTNAGGSLNCSSYWFPTAVDMRTGQPLKPNGGLIYYKDSYEFDISKKVELMPVGLRVVAGNAQNTDPAKASGRFDCVGPDGHQGPSAPTLPGAMAGGTCKKGGVLHFGIAFPYCWDGKNLDSPNHFSHMSWPEHYVAIKNADGEAVEARQGTPGSYFGKRCPASHPRVIPTISYSMSYPVTDDALVANIRFSSDLPGSEAGSSFHADYYMGWDVKTGQRWIDHCLRKNVDCHAYLLGDGYALY